MTPSSTHIPTLHPFTRDRFTWLSYGLFSYFAFLIIAIGPIMPFLRAEMGLSYAAGSLHLSMLAFGGLPTGIYGDWMMQRFGRHRVLWGGSAGMTIGTLLLVSGSHILITLTGAMIMGLAGTIIPIVVQAALADHHHHQRAVALTEVQIVVMISAGIVPGVIGASEYLGIGWRGGLLLAFGVWIMLVIFFRHDPIPTPPAHVQLEAFSSQERLPRIFWAYWCILFLGVGIEWCFSLWGANFLIAFAGFEPAVAATSMSLFFLGMISGRIVSRSIVTMFRTPVILLIMEAITLLGFLVFWLFPHPVLCLAGLYIAGSGIAGFFPLAIAAGMNIAPNLSNTASARSSLAAGLAMLLAPMILAQIADSVGLYTAFGVVIVLLVAVTGITLGIRKS